MLDVCDLDIMYYLGLYVGKQDNIMSKKALNIHTPPKHAVLDSVGFTVREWLIWLVSSDALLTPCGRRSNCTSEAGANKVSQCERLGFVAVYSSAQTTHSSPADAPAPLLVCRIDELSTQVSSRSLYIDKAIMHGFLLCITVSKTNGVSE